MSLRILPYSSRSFVVYGDTKPFSEKLKNLGGTFNRNLKGQAGWIFSSNLYKLEDIANSLGIKEDTKRVLISKMYALSDDEFQAEILFNQQYFPDGFSRDKLSRWVQLLTIFDQDLDLRKGVNFTMATLREDFCKELDKIYPDDV